MIYSLPKKIQGLWYAVFKLYYRKARVVTVRGIEIKLLPSVFHPTLYLSTEILLDYILDLKLNNQSVLELGTGNGLISLYLAKHSDLEIHASDINPAAITGINENASKNGLEIKTYVSDLFDDIPGKAFDHIFINPPFYKKEIDDNAGFAFFAGKEMEYFYKLFSQLKGTHLKNSTVLFVLSENAAIIEIESIAEEHGFEMKLEKKEEKKGEVFFILSLLGSHHFTMGHDGSTC